MNIINIDMHIGSKIRSRRHILGMSQTDLVDKIGVTFQQVQKYEKGHNKIVASRLLEVSNIMDVSIAYFFENFNNDQNDKPSEQLRVCEEALEFQYDQPDDMSNNSREAITLVKIYNNIPSKNARKKLLAFLKTLTQECS